MYNVYYVVVAKEFAAIRKRKIDPGPPGPLFESAFQCEGHVLPLQDALNFLGSRGEKIISIVNGPPLTYTTGLSEEMQLIVITET